MTSSPPSSSGRWHRGCAEWSSSAPREVPRRRQLPARLARHLGASGHDAIHTSELPNGNRTTDTAIAELADAEDRVVVTKDSDFRDSHLLRGTPGRLLVVATGNITNDALLALFDEHLDAIVRALEEVDFVELQPLSLALPAPAPCSVDTAPEPQRTAGGGRPIPPGR